MKNLIIVSVFFAGVILGAYFLKPVFVDSSVNDNYETYYGNCHNNYEISDWMSNGYLTDDERELISIKYNELLLEYDVQEESIYQDHYVMHDLMEELWEYAYEQGIEYGYNGTHHMGGMFR